MNPPSSSNWTFITGGARSGKSRYAQQCAEALSPNPVYVATARRWDEDFEQRIRRHQADRHNGWQTIEIDKNLASIEQQNQPIIIDCITLWLTNLFVDNGYDLELCLAEAKREIDQLKATPGCYFIVSNELGMGLHAETETGRKFTDLQGWVNQYIAARSENVVLMVSGIPLVVKSTKLRKA